MWCSCCLEEAALLPFGNGYVAVCPICKRILYNSDKKPEVKDEEEASRR